MKRGILSFLFIAGVILCSCNKEIVPEKKEYPKGIFNDGTAKVLLPSEGPLSVYKWRSDDKIRVCSEIYSLTDGKGAVEGTFEGTPIEDRYFTFAFPGGISSIDDYLARSFEGQKQEGNGSAAHLCNTVYVEDVTSCTDVELSETWAAAHEGTFRSNGVVAFDLALPADLGLLESITLEAAATRFPINNSGSKTAGKLVLALSGVTAGSDPLRAYLAVPEAQVEISSGLKMTIIGEKSCTMILSEQVRMGGGILTGIKVTDTGAWTVYSVVKGEGTQASPYILKTPQDLEQMKGLMVSGRTVWFELGADIDMTDVLNWEPLNTTKPFDKAVHFDGKGFTISNFSCKDKFYCSFFGVLNGYCANVTFDKASIAAQTAGSSMGVVAGFAGTADGVHASAENIHVRNASINATFKAGDIYPVGGIFGTMAYSAATDCSFDGALYSEAYGGAAESNNNRCPSGGIAGRVRESSSITRCTSSGSIIATKGRYIGGIAGWVSASENTPITGCTNNASVTGGVDRVAGIVGHYQQGTISACVNTGAISAQYNDNISGAGGIVGYSGPCNIVDCVNEGNVIGAKRYVGGILGCGENQTVIERCCSTGEVTGGSRIVGGIAGCLLYAGSAIRNCWTSGKVVCPTDQQAGGILGEMMQNQTVSCCYSTAAVEAARVVAGIVSRAAGGGWTCTTSHGDTIEKCIAWNTYVKATTSGSVSSLGGSGVVVGFTSFYNTLSSCWRSPSLVYTPSDTAGNAACDQPDCSPSSPYSTSTPGIAGTYGRPYHGKVAAAGDTVSSLATMLGWDTDIWDLTDDLPKFKKR